MIGVFGAGHERADEQHGLGKILEGELLADRLAVERPALEALQPFGDLFRCEQRHSVDVTPDVRTAISERPTGRIQIAQRRVGGAVEDEVADQLDGEGREHHAVSIVRRRVDQARHHARAARGSADRPVPSGEVRCGRRSSPRRRGPARATRPRRAVSRRPRGVAIRRSRRPQRSIRRAPIRPATARGNRRVPRSRGASRRARLAAGSAVRESASPESDVGALDDDLRRPAAGGEHDAIGFAQVADDVSTPTRRPAREDANRAGLGRERGAEASGPPPAAASVSAVTPTKPCVGINSAPSAAGIRERFDVGEICDGSSQCDSMPSAEQRRRARFNRVDVSRRRTPARRCRCGDR